MLACGSDSFARRRQLAASLRDSACTNAEAVALRGRGAPPSDPSRTFDAGLGEAAADASGDDEA